MDNPHLRTRYCTDDLDMLFCCQKEVNNVESKKNLIAKMAKKAAESALRRDANNTTCVCIYQPKAPEKLKQFKNKK